MKYIKMLGLAAVAAMALMAFVGTGTASADVLCPVNSTPECPVAAAKEIVSSLKSGTSAVLETTAGEKLVTCTESGVSGTVEKQGEGVEPEGAISSLTWGGCSSTTDTLKPGRLKLETRIVIIEGKEVHTITQTVSGAEVTVSIFGVSCVYGPGAEPISIGDLTVGEPATLEANAVVNKVSGGFLCPTDNRWTATYQVNKPAGLWLSKK